MATHEADDVGAEETLPTTAQPESSTGVAAAGAGGAEPASPVGGASASGGAVGDGGARPQSAAHLEARHASTAL